MIYWERIPALIAAVCLTIYWFWVIVMLVRLSRKIGKDPNAMPRERVGQLMRILWYPCILILLVGLWLTASIHVFPFDTTGGKAFMHGWLWMPAPWWYFAVIPATGICITFTIITFVCWRKMGKSWRIGIDPNETLVLVSSGPYQYVRHPIYALRMVINLCAFFMAPTLVVAIPAAIDFILLQIEARREEAYMEATHGQAYSDYKKKVGRFIPKPPARL